ncbi:ABC transporter permease [Exiguobacterium sp. B2(2022)]|uniref:ABC transporter permease n=1 Tax=Exiguobacterium sp. B2(2022) TaxID=2992755 RepID=UPI00237AAC61|nr:ABC transporter permease subunit [Exiguobacterium sp. B2(2022)]MDE0563026.1 ABC transporter permease [Exiguobacterium sp. B2(2022)]
MRTAIFKQEWRESWVNKRLIWIPIALMLLASMQPLTLYFLPDILASGGNLPDGAVIEIPTPTPEEVLISVSEQLRQIGLLVVLLSAMHTFSHERTNGTLAWLKSLQIPTSRIVVSKWGHYALLSVGSILLAQTAAAYYTVILFDAFDWLDFLISTTLLICHFVVQLSIFFLIAAMLESGVVAVVLTLGLHFVMSLLIGWVDLDWMPWMLGPLSSEVLLTEVDLMWPLVTGMFVVSLSLYVASKRLRFMSHSA